MVYNPFHKCIFSSDECIAMHTATEGQTSGMVHDYSIAYIEEFASVFKYNRPSVLAL